jgi:hypothetical protein
MSKALELTGKKFGYLTVVVKSKERARRSIKWICECDSPWHNDKVLITVVGSYLVEGRRLSCGCLQKEKARKRLTAHGEAGRSGRSAEYRTYRSILYRCYNPNNPVYDYYCEAAGRGVSDRWRFGENGNIGFECFLEDMGRKPYSKLTIERRDNSKGYSKENCYWATRKQQRHNQPERQSKTGYIGVFKDKRTGRYRASIWNGRKAVHLGVFDNPEQAAQVYAAAAALQDAGLPL